MRNTLVRLLISLFLAGGNLALSAPQTVWTVDQNNGPGTDFTAIQPAIDAAANGDIVLVREGQYPEELQIQNKGISLVSDPESPTIPRLYHIVIRSISEASAVSIENFEIYCSPSDAGPLVRIEQAAGSVLLEDLTRIKQQCQFPYVSTGVDLIRIVDSSSVVMNRFSTDFGLLASFFPQATLTLKNSTVRLHSSRIYGAGGTSRPGIQLLDSNLLVEASSVRGGSGTVGYCCGTFGESCCGTPTAGGNGIEVLASGLAGTSLIVDSEIAPWDPTAPGAALATLGYCVCPPSPPGQFAILNLSPGNHAVLEPMGKARELSASSPIQSGATLNLELKGLDGDVAFLGYSTALPEVAGKPLSGLPLLGSNFQILPLGLVPPSGSLQVSSPAPVLPAQLGGARVFLQAAVINSGGALRFSNLETLVLLN